MTTRNLDGLFQPSAIALVGASNAPGSVGQVLARNLLESGFAGPVLPVALSAASVRSALAYRTVGELPVAPDLAVIATPPATVPQLIADLGARGCRAAVVITAGLGPDLRQAMLDAARPNLLRILGPNGLGFISPGLGVNASFAHLTPATGGLALVTQSGAVAAAAIDWAHARGIGFSHILSIGDAADIDLGDLLDYLALDPKTRGVLVYLESLRDARKFMTAGRIAARAKPVVVIKAGKSAGGARAAFSHTGALAGSDLVYDAALRRAGMLRVGDLRELFDAAATLAARPVISGDRLAILTNGGGAGVMAADALEAGGGRPAELTSETLSRLRAAGIASQANPVDILGDAKPQAYGRAMEALLAEPNADAILVMNCPTAVADSTEAAEAVVAAVRGARRHVPVISAWLGQTAAAEGRRRLAAAGVAAHETPEEAVRAFLHLVEHRRNQSALVRTPTTAPPTEPDRARAAEILARARRDGRAALTDPESRTLLAAYGVPVIESRTAATPAEVGRLAAGLGDSLALKILSPDISHKSEVGGVALGLPDAAIAEAEAQAMLARVAAARPGARVEGFVIEPMVRRPEARELLAGIAHDPTFGPVVMFGAGGVAVEVVADRVIGLPPLDDSLARDMIARARIWPLLQAYRDRAPADLARIAEVLVRLAQLAIDLPEVAELDINPLLADADGVLALDARVGLHPTDAVTAPPAILPYPAQLQQEVELAGEALLIRPVRPRDGPALARMVKSSAPDDVRLRFRSGFRTLPPGWPERLSQIDYDREMAFVAEGPDDEILGVSRLAGDPQGETAEFALMVRSDRQDQGLGRLLLAKLLDYAGARGLKTLWGDVATENHRMLTMTEAFGFRSQAGEEVGRVKVIKSLNAGRRPGEES